jgi:hypothetical protein
LIQSPSCMLRRALMRLPSTCSATSPSTPSRQVLLALGSQAYARPTAVVMIHPISDHYPCLARRVRRVAKLTW